MGEKKQAEKSRKRWTKVLAIIAGVLFVVLMVVSSMGSSWMTSLASVKPGDVVVLDYTIRDSHGYPLVTSDQAIYTQAIASGDQALYSKQLTITANQSLTQPIYPVQVYTSQSGWGQKYAIFASEYDELSTGILGLKTNEKKTINTESSKPMTQNWTDDQLMKNNLNLSDMRVGQVLSLGVSDDPEAAITNTSVYYIRMGEIANVTGDGIILDFSHPNMDISVVSINKG
ncbi:MAG: hypothetical protein WC391_01425 [Methanoregula sp.]|jgi:hypothetical protein